MNSKKLLAMNARLGDGSYWKHPECINYKIVFTGTNYPWIKYKADLMSRPITLRRSANNTHKGVFANSKTLWATTSFVDELYTEYKNKSVERIVNEMSLDDITLWFLDDGCTVIRKGKHCSGSTYKHLLCVGNLLYGTSNGIELFLNKIRALFPDVKTVGTLGKNNSKTTDKNLVWNMPIPIAEVVIGRALALKVPGFENKLRTTMHDQASEIILNRSSLPEYKGGEAEGCRG